MASSGDWGQLRLLPKGISHRQERLKNGTGQLVSSEERAETMATHLETVQWAVRPVIAAPPRADLGSPLPVNVDEIRLDFRERRACSVRQLQANLVISYRLQNVRHGATQQA